MFIDQLTSNPTHFFRVVIIVIFSVVLHELAHGMAALWQGDPTPEEQGHMTLNPIKHMGFTSLFFLAFAGIAWGQMPVTPSNFRSKKWGDFFVSLAGPAMNLVLAILAIVLMRLLISFDAQDKVDFVGLQLIAILNLLLMMFNLLPLPPLDGFQALASKSKAFKKLGESPFAILGFLVFFASGAASYLMQFAGDIVTFAVRV